VKYLTAAKTIAFFIHSFQTNQIDPSAYDLQMNFKRSMALSFPFLEKHVSINLSKYFFIRFQRVMG